MCTTVKAISPSALFTSPGADVEKREWSVVAVRERAPTLSNNFCDPLPVRRLPMDFLQATALRAADAASRALPARPPQVDCLNALALAMASHPRLGASVVSSSL